MSDYKELYYSLFNKLTDIIEELKDVQIQMEEMYGDSNLNYSENND